MNGQAIGLLGRTPSFSKQAIDVGSQHRSRVVKGEDRIKTTAFELSLSRYTATPSLCRLVVTIRKIFLNHAWVVWVHVGADLSSGVDMRANNFKELSPRMRALIDSRAVLFPGDRCEFSLCRHLYNLKTNDPSRFRLDHNGNRKGLEPEPPLVCHSMDQHQSGPVLLLHKDAPLCQSRAMLFVPPKVLETRALVFRFERLE